MKNKKEFQIRYNDGKCVHVEVYTHKFKMKELEEIDIGDWTIRFSNDPSILVSHKGVHMKLTMEGLVTDSRLPPIGKGRGRKNG